MPGVVIDVIVNAGSGAVNGSSGQADLAGEFDRKLKQRLADLFAANHIDARIELAHSGAAVVESAKRAVKSDAEIIVAGGGDGTINSVAAEMIGSEKPLGILPFGTLNHLAKDLGIPLDLEGAVKTIHEGQLVQIDVGEVNDHFFVNNSSLGLYPSIVRERQKQQRLGWGKWPAFIWAAVGVLRRYPFLGVRLSVDGHELVTRTPFVFVGNNEYEMESLHVGTRSCLDAGKLSLYVTSRIGRLGLLRLALRALFGGLRQEKDFLALCSNEIWIETKHKRLRVALDGEITIMHPPLRYRVRPRALRVIVPRARPR